MPPLLCNGIATHDVYKTETVVTYDSISFYEYKRYIEFYTVCGLKKNSYNMRLLSNITLMTVFNIQITVRGHYNLDELLMNGRVPVVRLHGV